MYIITATANMVGVFIIDMKVAILIDSMYLQNIANYYEISKLDIRKLQKLLLEENEMHFKTFVFDALPFTPRENATEEQKTNRTNKHKYLTRLSYFDRTKVEWGQVRPKFIKCNHCKNQIITPIQKLVDVKLAVKLVYLSWSKIVDKIILITGDKDMLPAINAVENTTIPIKLVYANTPRTITSKEIIKCCSEKKELTKSDIQFLAFDEE